MVVLGFFLPPVSIILMTGRSRRSGAAGQSEGHGRHTAVVSGGPRLDPTAPPSGTVWVIDLRRRTVIATVTGVGNDPYG